MNTDGPWPADILERMIGAVNAVQERLTRSTAALERAAVPYAVIGAKAVAHWVATKDEGAVRNTPNVDILLRRTDFPHARRALEAVGFIGVESQSPQANFLDGPSGKLRQAARLWFCGDVLKPGTEPLPDIVHSIRAELFQVIALAALVRMKLSAFRTIDRVHLQDLIGAGTIDATWPERFPEVLAERLRQILANLDG